MAFQTVPQPVEVYNGPDEQYRVNSRLTAGGAHTQLVGIGDDWVDAFGRVRISATTTLFEASFTYDTQPILFEPVTAPGGTITQADAALRLTVDGTPGAIAAVQSRQYIPYEKGKSQLVKATGILGPPTVGVRTRIGYYDAADGFYVQQDADGPAVVRRSSTTGTVVETVIRQAGWNLDPMDGTGPSGLTLDPTRAQILVIDGQWLGVGRVRVGLNIDGTTHYVHEWRHANREVVAPYTRSFTLPIRYEIETVTSGGAGTLTAVCCDVESEGGVDDPVGFGFAAANEVDVPTSTVRTAVLSIRPALEFPAGGRTNRTFLVPGDVSLLVGSSDCLIDVLYAPTLTGGTWTRANPHSAVEVGIGQTIDDPGLVIDRYYANAGQRNGTTDASGGSVVSRYPLTLDAAGTNPRALTIAATALGAGTIRAATRWREVR